MVAHLIGMCAMNLATKSEMNESESEHFDDPQLKAALRRALPRERASVALQSRIEQSLADLSGASLRSGSSRRMLAAAAVLVIGIGLSVLFAVGSKEQPAPQWFADSMVATHDQSVALPGHRLPDDIGSTDPATIQQKLVEKVGHPVMVAMPGDGWQFASAGVSEVSRIPAAHLIFTRGDQTLSIFSVPAGALYQNGSDGNLTYSQIDRNHEIAGFMYKNAVHCLVAYDKSGKLTLADTIKLRDQLRDQLGMTAAN
jgi:hypothetical protein